MNSAEAINGSSTVGSLFANLRFEVTTPSDTLALLDVFILTTAQALSLIPYNVIDLRSTPPHAPMEKEGATYFYYWRSRRVWMYSFGSGTAILGAVVVVIGMVIAISRTLLALYEKFWHNYTTRALSPTELVVATLSHRPEEHEFDHCCEGFKAAARVRYKIEDDEGGVLKFRAQKTSS